MCNNKAVNIILTLLYLTRWRYRTQVFWQNIRSSTAPVRRLILQWLRFWKTWNFKRKTGGETGL